MSMGQMPRMLGYGLAGNALVYFGLAVINGRVAPSALAGLYAATGPALRAVAVMILFCYPANLIIAGCFRLGSVAGASMAVLATTVLAMVASVLLLDGPLTARAWIAAASVLAASAWFAYESSPH